MKRQNSGEPDHLNVFVAFPKTEAALHSIIDGVKHVPMQAVSWLALAVSSLPDRKQLARQHDIDAVRGIAIFLVVIGHVVARDMPLGNSWYGTLKELIYRFHMPLFMTLTGISFALSLPKFPSWRPMAFFAGQKLSRLVVPYLFFGILILIGKLVASRFVHVDNLPRGSMEDVLALLVHPNKSVASFLWFIYVLGIYYLTLPTFLQITQRRPIFLFLIALACQAVLWPTEFLLDQAFFYLPYFTAGILLWLLREKWVCISISWTLMWIVLFGCAMSLAIPLALPKWLLGALAVPAFLGLAQHIPPRVQRWLAKIGQLSLSIYLMNTIIIGLCKGLMLKVVPWDGIFFLIYFPLLTLAGVALPMVVKQLVHRYLPRADRYV